jgi:hypothetical protein
LQVKQEILDAIGQTLRLWDHGVGEDDLSWGADDVNWHIMNLQLLDWNVVH